MCTCATEPQGLQPDGFCSAPERAGGWGRWQASTDPQPLFSSGSLVTRQAGVPTQASRQGVSQHTSLPASLPLPAGWPGHSPLAKRPGFEAPAQRNRISTRTLFPSRCLGSTSAPRGQEIPRMRLASAGPKLSCPQNHLPGPPGWSPLPISATWYLSGF